MPKTTKSSSQRKLNFDDAGGNSIAKQVERVQQRGQKRASPPLDDHQNTESYISPKKKQNTGTVTAIHNVVTPESLETAKKVTLLQTKSGEYIPEYIHKNVDYIRKVKVLKLSPIQSRVLQWIHDNFDVPNDFEQNRKYGPLSGSSYPDRVITAYRLGSLERIKRTDGVDVDDDNDDKIGSSKHSVICTVCADLGHIADACPTLL